MEKGKWACRRVVLAPWRVAGRLFSGLRISRPPCCQASSGCSLAAAAGVGFHHPPLLREGNHGIKQWSNEAMKQSGNYAIIHSSHQAIMQSIIGSNRGYITEKNNFPFGYRHRSSSIWMPSKTKTNYMTRMCYVLDYPGFVTFPEDFWYLVVHVGA